MMMTECNPENVYNLSHFCVSYKLMRHDIECFNRKVSPAFTDFITVWCILNAICGTFGNLLTLLAVPWAAYKKRYYVFPLCSVGRYFMDGPEFNLF